MDFPCVDENLFTAPWSRLILSSPSWCLVFFLKSLTVLLHALVAVIATPHHVHVAHTSEHACFVPDKPAEGSGKLSFGVLSLT